MMSVRYKPIAQLRVTKPSITTRSPSFRLEKVEKLVSALATPLLSCRGSPAGNRIVMGITGTTVRFMLRHRSRHSHHSLIILFFPGVGKGYHNSGHGEDYGPPFTTGDVVGAAINFRKAEVFFTKNGRHLGTAFRNVRARLFPTVGTHRQIQSTPRHVNPYTFDLFKIRRGLAESRSVYCAAVMRGSVPTLAPRRSFLTLR
jgi:hypothetical protein